MTDYLQAILHQFSQALLVPVMIVLVLLILIAIWCIGSALVELFTERRHFKVNLPKIINAMENASFSKINEVICASGLLWRQKAALLLVANNAGLPEDALFSLAKGEIERSDKAYSKRVGRTDLLTKVAPMMGLMATLIPLGPGIVAMGENDVTVLSASLGVAFDGTVAGLVSAVVAMTVSYVRKRWYASYRIALESLMTTLLEKIEIERAAGTALPSNFSTDDLEPLRLRAKELMQGASKTQKPAGAAL